MKDDFSRRIFLQTGCLSLAGVAASRLPAFPVNDSPERPVFPFGTHIYRQPPLPPEQLRADLPLLKKLGFNMVKIQESWSADETREGEIDLSAVTRLVSDARQNGLFVYFGVTMEQAPAWLWRKFPDAQMLWETGQPYVDPTQYLLPNDGKPGPCWNHPGARAAGIRFAEEVGKQIGKYDNILVWNVWQEVALNVEAIPNHVGVCYCPNTLAAFQGWLKTRYSSLSDLNNNWRTSYGDWSEVDPPRRFTKVPSQIDWGYFMENIYLAQGLRWKAEALRRTDPQKRRILAHTGGARFGSSADWRLAKEVDVYGSSNYPGWGEYQDPDVSDEQRVLTSPAVTQQLLDNALRWDYLRGCSQTGEIWTAELQGGRAGGGVNPGRVPDPGDIRRWLLGALAGGVHGICFWNHRSEPFWDEAYGFGLMELRGGETPRAKEAGRIGAAVNEKAGELLAQGRCPQASIAIVIDEDLWNFVRGSGEPLSSAFVSNLRGIHRALFLEGHPVDFVDAGDVPEKGRSYKILIHPCPIALGNGAISALRAYVNAGGTLISGPCPGRFDKFGFGSPGEMPAAVEELFGVQHRQLISLRGRQPHPSQSSLHPESLSPLFLTVVGEHPTRPPIRMVHPDFYLQYLSAVSATPLLRYKTEIVAASNSFGSGRAILIGTLLGSTADATGLRENQAFLASLVSAAGVQPDRVGKLIRRRRQHGTKQAWFLFNLDDKPASERLPLEASQAASDLLSGPSSNALNEATVTVAPRDIACLLIDQSR